MHYLIFNTTLRGAASFTPWPFYTPLQCVLESMLSSEKSLASAVNRTTLTRQLAWSLLY